MDVNTPKAMRILLIGHDPSDDPSVRQALAGGVRDGSMVVEYVPRLADGLERLRGTGIAAVLLDLSLPDSQGISTFSQVWRAAPLVARQFGRLMENGQHGLVLQ